MRLSVVLRLSCPSEGLFGREADTSTAAEIYDLRCLQLRSAAGNSPQGLSSPAGCYLMTFLNQIKKWVAKTKAPAGGRTARKGCCCPHRRAGASDNRLCRMRRLLKATQLDFSLNRPCSKRDLHSYARFSLKMQFLICSGNGCF